ncbi:putative bifunctional diguanylate cyclase/phosphodiesterase [Paraglaciecola marina]|uniref:putative bifunctional diguanylate cyclase/phosphodiesterase n=1 Tax=Paraglaciecola marina TaxID=2500157 RepID=UPI001EF0774E|nr:bifunctional diguanylate cyclase/phosphodiesterase [Paraglaciecola marina]
MRRYLSLPFKIMGLFMAFLLIASISLTYLWVGESNQNYAFQQKKLHDKDQQQFQLIRDMLRTQVESWFASFLHFQAEYSQNPGGIASFLEDEFEYLQFEWHINNLWILEGEGNLYFSTSKTTPEYIFEDASKALKTQSSFSYIRCLEECQQLITMPILTQDGDMLVLSIGSSLIETLAALNRSTFAKLAILSTDSTFDKTEKLANLKVKMPISFSNQEYMQNILAQLPANLSISELLDSGYRFENEQGVYLLSLTAVDPELGKQTYLLFVHDISEQSLAHQRYQKKVFLISISVVVLCSITLVLLSMQFRKRLLLLAAQLPLLASKKYRQFRTSKFAKSHLFIDEIELLQDSACLLADELESMDRKIELNTRELENIAMYDRLTGLPNRNMLNHQLKKQLASLKRDSNKVIVMLLDFDKFRKINDTHGHQIGDSFLAQAARRIRGSLRDSDMLFRFGGDEFVVVFLEKAMMEGAPILASKIIESFREPIAVDQLLFYSSCSIGITSTNNADILVDDLVRQSDIAMYASKDSGGGQYDTFTNNMLTAVIRKVELENEVRNALEQGQFSFALQPQVNIDSGKLIGFEALLRWIHPERGFIPPDEFIPLIESSENMLKIGYWGLKKAFEILKEFDELGYQDLKIAVNLSASQFLDPDLLPFLREQVRVFRRSPSQIELELTERTVVADIDHTLEIMRQLKEMGFIFSIDDFGTGYSSLAYLKQMPVDIIKIDRSFVSGMNDNSADMQIVSSTIAMVQNLGMKVVAEGIETSAQFKLLSQLKCEIGQGYFISRPISEADLYSLLPDKLESDVWEDLDKIIKHP